MRRLLLLGIGMIISAMFFWALAPFLLWFKRGRDVYGDPDYGEDDPGIDVDGEPEFD